MTRFQAKCVEGAIIGLCVLAVLMVFQGFSLALFSAGCVMVVVGALSFNLIPFAREGVPVRTLLRVVLIVLVILCIAAALGVGTSFLYVAYLEFPPAMTRAYDVSVVGLYILDVLGRPVTAIPEGGNVGFIDEIRLTVAGTAGGTVMDLAKLGLKCLAVGAVGGDEKADFVLDRMAGHGIDCHLMQRLKGVETSATILNVRPNGERPALHARGASDHFDIDAATLPEVLDCRFLHLGGTGLLARLDGEPSRRLLQAAQEAGCVTTWDLVGAGPDTWAFVEPLLPHIDYFIPSIEEAEILSGLRGVEQNIRFFQGRGVKCCVLTMGGDGSVIAMGDQRIHVSAYAIEVVDTTGCGDAYTAGFIAGLADGRSLEECAHLGTASASLVASGLGSEAGIIDRAQVEAAMGRVAGVMRAAAVAGTFDTKGEELGYIATLLRGAGVAVRTVDLGTSGTATGADIAAGTIAACHPDGAAAALGVRDRGAAVTAMAEAFAAYVRQADWIGGMIGAGGSGGTALVAPAMRALPVGLPKVLVSTVASGNVAPYVGPADIMMMYSVTDVQGLNRISRRVLGNAAHALAGMMLNADVVPAGQDRPAVGLTMFGVTTVCVSHIAAALAADHDPLVFHATGTGGQSMEKLVDSGLIGGVVDLTTTEIADMLVGGVFPAAPDRMGAVIRTGVPYVGSCGALDMVNFGARDTVPERFRGRLMHVHNPQVTLMRTTAAENRAFGDWIAGRLNLMQGPVRFLLPEGGVSALDAPGQPFHDPAADAALFEAIEAAVQQSDLRRILRVPHNLNSVAFADIALAQFREIADA